jgi:glutamate synthase (NADPH) large chain
MDHRGATGADKTTGDGAGLLMQIPHEFITEVLNINVGEKGTYGTGIIFLPKEENEANFCIEILNKYIREEGLILVGYRDVPVDSSVPGEIAKTTEPAVKQIFVRANLEKDALERKLYLVRKLAEKEIRDSELKYKDAFYQPSFSAKIIVYKGMFTPSQLRDYYLDFKHIQFKSAIALVHSRFSTNTFPTWNLAQPFRIIAHNGEINTIRGNRLWMQAREGLMKSEIFGEDLKKLLPIIEPGKSDSASFDNVLEFLHMTGRTIPHALCMMIPESFNQKNPIPESLKAFTNIIQPLWSPGMARLPWFFQMVVILAELSTETVCGLQGT